MSFEPLDFLDKDSEQVHVPLFRSHLVGLHALIHWLASTRKELRRILDAALAEARR